MPTGQSLFSIIFLHAYQLARWWTIVNDDLVGLSFLVERNFNALVTQLASRPKGESSSTSWLPFPFLSSSDGKPTCCLILFAARREHDPFNRLGDDWRTIEHGKKSCRAFTLMMSGWRKRRKQQSPTQLDIFHFLFFSDYFFFERKKR